MKIELSSIDVCYAIQEYIKNHVSGGGWVKLAHIRVFFNNVPVSGNFRANIEIPRKEIPNEG